MPFAWLCGDWTGFGCFVFPSLFIASSLKYCVSYRRRRSWRRSLVDRIRHLEPLRVRYPFDSIHGSRDSTVGPAPLATRFSLHLVKDALENVGPAVPVRAPARSLIKFPARLIWLEAQSLMANISVALADCRNWRVSCAARSPALAFDPASANLPRAFISASASAKFVPPNCRRGDFVPLVLADWPHLSSPTQRGRG